MYLVQRMTFSPLAVREMFLAQTGTSRGGLGRGRGAEEEVPSDGDTEEDEVVTEAEVVEEVQGLEALTEGDEQEAVGSTSSVLLLFFLSSSSSSSSSSSCSSSSFSSVRGKEASHNALL